MLSERVNKSAEPTQIELPVKELFMAWTQTDFDAVDAAIRAVPDGTRRQSVSSETGALAFVNTPLLDLIKLRDAIRLELDATAASSPQRPRLYVMRQRRGL
jgi:hypothetical protein